MSANTQSAVATTPATLVKCLVWDLDETMWHGTLLENDKPVLRPGVRETIIELDRRGVLNSVASRNDHDQAWQWLQRFGLAEYIVMPQIGWSRKSNALRRIADALRFATGALAFIDDQPHELAEVGAALPDVRRFRSDEVSTLRERPEFAATCVTSDAAQRRQRYQQGFARDAAREAFQGLDDDFVRSLQIGLRISRATPADLQRLSELTVRTTQMNATGVTYDNDTLAALVGDPAHEVLVVTMQDRFGDHGAVGVVLLGMQAGAWHLKLLATSCRVVTFGAGSVVLAWLIDAAAQAGADLIADFRETGRNRIMHIAYRFAGFTEVSGGATTRPAPANGNVQRLHLRPTRRRPPETMRVSGVRPGVPTAETEWLDSGW